MRILSFVLAFAFVLAGPALRVSPSQDKLPGVGTFTYSGSPITSDTPTVVMLASR
jgi:hypothetical protein